MWRYNMFLIIVQLFFFESYSQDDVSVGSIAPSIEFSQCLNKKADADFYKGKTTVLEFWATWCAPCIAGFPHINELSDKYSSPKVLFVSITREREIDKIKSTLAKRPLNAYHLIDTNSATSKKFGVESLPQTFVIAENGIIIWQGYYSELTDKLLERLIREQKPLEVEEGRRKNIFKGQDRFILRANLSANQEASGWGKSLNNHTPDEYGRFGWECKEWSFLNFFGLQLNGYNPIRIKSNKPDFNIDVEYFCDTAFTNRPLDILTQSLQGIFKFTSKEVQSNESVWMFSPVSETKLKQAASKVNHSSIASNKREIIFLGQSVSEICKFLERRLNVFFDYSKGERLTKFDLTIPVENAGTIEKLNSYLKDKYGFIFTQKEQRITKLKLIFE